MARRTRMSLSDAMETYKGGGNNDFFTLADDKQVAKVRFLYGSNEDELDWYVVHEVEIGGKKRWVQCHEDADCPLCAVNNKAQLKIFIQLVDYRDNKVKTWERGRNFIPKLIGQINRYGNLYSRPFEVERNGKKGDTSTTYELFPLDPDNVKWEDLPQKQELVGHDGFILDRGIEDLRKMAEGTFAFTPVNGGTAESRTPASERQPAPSERRTEEPAPRRETPTPRQNAGSDIF
jgi:hypothetical protein